MCIFWHVVMMVVGIMLSFLHSYIFYHTQWSLCYFILYDYMTPSGSTGYQVRWLGLMHSFFSLVRTVNKVIFLQCHCLALHFSTNNFYSYLRGNYCWNGNNIPSAKEIPNRFYSQKNKFSYYVFSFTLIMIVLKVHTFMHMSYYTILPHMKKKRSGYAHFTKNNFNTRKITMDIVFT